MKVIKSDNTISFQEMCGKLKVNIYVYFVTYMFVAIYNGNIRMVQKFLNRTFSQHPL